MEAFFHTKKPPYISNWHQNINYIQ